METIISTLNGIIWSKALIYLCLDAGIYFSIRTRFLQIRHFKEMIRLLMGGGSSEQGVSSLQAFAMSVAGRVGTGNVAGVATAIAFLGSGTSFIECALAQVYKDELHGEYRGGPAYYIEKGLGNKAFAKVFVAATVLGLFGAPFITVALFYFVFTTFLAYYYIAETNSEYLFKEKSKGALIKNSLRVIFLGSAYYGAIKTATVAWGLADVGVGIMAWLNIIVILVMGNIGLKVLKDFEDQKKQGIESDQLTFDPDKLGIKNADLWYSINKRNGQREKDII